MGRGSGRLACLASQMTSQPMCQGETNRGGWPGWAAWEAEQVAPEQQVRASHVWAPFWGLSGCGSQREGGYDCVQCTKRVSGWGCWVRQALQRPGIVVCRLDTHGTSEATASPQVRSQVLHVEGETGPPHRQEGHGVRKLTHLRMGVCVEKASPE